MMTAADRTLVLAGAFALLIPIFVYLSWEIRRLNGAPAPRGDRSFDSCQ